MFLKGSWWSDLRRTDFSKKRLMENQVKLSCFSPVSVHLEIWLQLFWRLLDQNQFRASLIFKCKRETSFWLFLFFQELEFANLTAVLHCIHSFIAAKVATVDPVFVNNQVSRRSTCAAARNIRVWRTCTISSGSLILCTIYLVLVIFVRIF